MLENDKRYNMASMKSSQLVTKSHIFSTYRTLLRLVRRQPESTNQLQTFRSTFRKNALLTDEEAIKSKILEAGEKITYLRIITSKNASAPASLNCYSASTNKNDTTRFIYRKVGVKEIKGDGSTGTLRTSDGRVVSIWSMNNLDPCSVKIHQL